MAATEAILDQKDFRSFWPTGHSNASNQVSSKLAFRFKRKSEKQTFKMVAMVAILDFGSEQF